jgi:hypothetical protein
VISKRANDQIKYNNRNKVASDFKGKDLRRSNCFNCDFSESNFDETSFRGAQFKGCSFTKATFNGAELVAVNFKNASFREVHFENTLFDTANVEGVDFEGATFTNVIFVNTDLSVARNVNLESQDAQVFDVMPELEISKELEKVIQGALKNEFIKFARVLDTKEGAINPISVMRLLQKFDEETLIKGLRVVKKSIDNDFATLQTIINHIS